MATSIKRPVGENGTNDPADVKLVQTLLNKYIAAGYLPPFSLLAIDGRPEPTIPVIKEFQRKVVGFHSPDGKVDPLPGTTMTRLSENVVGLTDIFLRHSMAITNAGLGPLGDIKADAWLAAMQALVRNAHHIHLQRPHITTIVDFRIHRDTKRLWTVDLDKRKVLIHTWVAHGTNSGKAGIPTSFGDGDKKSSLGPYVTLRRYLSNLGHLHKQPAMKVEGLEKGTNGRALARGVVFHGADYVNPGRVGNSWGCFSTPADVNPTLIDTIRDGTFVFAYHDTYRTP